MCSSDLGSDYFNVSATGIVKIGSDTVPVVTSTAPSIALSSSASSGSSTTALRSDATIAAFDATTPAALSASAATGSINYAARRDHVHPTTGLQLTSEKSQANGYASLDASTKVPIAQIPTGSTSTTVSLGDHTHTTDWGTSSGTATTVTNTTTESSLWSFTLPANTLGTANGVHVKMFGTMVNNSGANRAYTISVKYGATTIFSDALANIGANAASRAWVIDLTLGAANATNSQTLIGTMSVSSTASATTGTGDLNSADTITQRTFYGTSAEDSTADKTFNVTITFPANTSTQTWTRTFGSADMA